MLGKLPDDPELEELDPIMKMWMLSNWVEDQNENFELLKNHGYLVGSFINPEAVKKAIGADASTYSTSEEEFEESTKMVAEAQEQKIKEDQKPHRRRKKKIITE